MMYFCMYFCLSNAFINYQSKLMYNDIDKLLSYKLQMFIMSADNIVLYMHIYLNINSMLNLETYS